MNPLKMLSRGGAVSAPSDADFENVTLLLHGDGTNGAQNNTFLDSSTNNFTITRNGNTTQGTFTPFSKVDGRWGNYFDGSGDYLTVPDNAAFTVGSGNWTLEAWVYPTASPNQPIIFGQWSGGTDGSIAMMLSNDGNRYLRGLVYSGGYVDRVSTSSLQLNAWNHCAFVREGTYLNLYLNGTRVENYNWGASSIQDSSLVVSIGASSSGSQPFQGNISNARFVKGTAVYSGATYTPPTAPLTAITNTQLLTCQSNRFIDNSTNAFTITRNGDVKVTPFSPFPTLTAYDAATNGGSGYFDGSGDYLSMPTGQTPLLLGNSDFTFECWVYTLNSNNANIFGGQSDLATAAGSSYGFSIRGITSDLYIGSSNFNITSPSPVAGSWAHLAYARTGGTFSSYLNGVRVGTRTDLSTSSVNNGATTYPGGMGATAGFNPLNGYISGARLIKGSGGYDATQTTITIPTAPPTAITNTSLLCNFTNAGIFDNSMSNDLETVGNAQIDTTTKKYGTGSMEFDGTGDWLTIANTPDLQLGTGNFTVEFWVYLATGDTGSNRGLVGKGGASTGWLVSLNTTQKVVFTYASSTITSSGAITTNAWNHIAVVREGTGSNQTKIYIGGTNDGTGTVNTDFNQTEIMYVGANRTGSDPMKGFIDDLRITKGIARYTSNFTAPTAALPDIGE